MTTLFVGNLDQAMGTDGTPVIGSRSRKCLAVSLRGIHCGDAALLYQKPDERYLEYCNGVYGSRIQVYAPRLAAKPDGEDPLSLLGPVLADSELVSRLSAHGLAQGWELEPFLQHQQVYELGRKAGLPVAGVTEEALRRGLVSSLNSKKEFQIACRELDIPVPDSVHVKGTNEVIRAAVAAFAKYGSVMLRQAHGAGGIGNLFVTEEVLAKAGLPLEAESDAGRRSTAERVTAYLGKKLTDGRWETDDVLVEECLYRGDRAVVASPTVLMRITGGVVRLIAVSLRIERNGRFIGSETPADLPRAITDRLVRHAVRYARHAVKRGYTEGPLNFQAGVLANGEVVAFESDARNSGDTHPAIMRQRLFPDNCSGMVTLSNDAIAVAPKTSFSKVLVYLKTDEGRKIGWNRDLAEGAIVTIPPIDGNMGVVIFSMTHAGAAGLMEAIQEATAREFTTVG